MPCLNLSTNVSLERVDTSALLTEATRVVADVIQKPLNQPAAYGEVVSVGGVEAIPAGLNNLDKLDELYGFKPDKNSLEGSSSLDGLESLSRLNRISLDGLERVSDREIAKRANLRSKNQLQRLSLAYTSLSCKDQVSQTKEKKIIIEGILNELSPPHSLHSLSIDGYFGNHLPNWLNLDADLPNLSYLRFQNCACFEELASFGQLPNLDFLLIKGAYSLMSVREEFMLGDIESRDPTVHAMSCYAGPAFPKLNELIFEGMPNWKEWQWNKGQPAMPKLKDLVIKACPKLRSLPEDLSHHATSLEYLEIDVANNLMIIENFPFIKHVHFVRNPIMERISNLDSVSFIEIEECPNLKTLENLKSLQMMMLIDNKMKILPDCLMTIMPQKLKIQCSEELLLKIATQGESGSEWHKFKHTHTIKIYSPDESLCAIYQKTPFSFTTNISTMSVQR